MERKRDLTINEIEKLLEKQALWKRKRDKFNIDTKLFHNGERVAAVDEYAPSNCERNSSKLKIDKKVYTKKHNYNLHHLHSSLMPTSSSILLTPKQMSILPDHRMSYLEWIYMTLNHPRMDFNYPWDGDALQETRSK